MKYLCLLILFVSNPLLYAQKDLSQLSYETIDSFIMVSYRQHNYKQAILYSKVGRDKAKAEYGAIDTIVAEYIGNLGFFHKSMGQYKEAEQFLLESNNMVLQTQGKDHPDYSMNLSNLGSLYMEMSRLEEAEPIYLEALENRAKNFGKEHPKYALLLNSIGNLYQAMEQYEKAEAAYLKAKAIRAKVYGENHPRYATTLNNLASLYHSMQMLERAETLLLLSLNIKVKANGEMHPSNARIINNLAGLYRDMNRYAAAESFYLKASKIETLLLGEDHPSHATILINLASLYQKMAQYSKAEKFYLKAEKIYAKTMGKESLNYSAVLNNLAILYQDTKEYKKAEKCHFLAKDIRAKKMGKESMLYATSLNNLASFYLATGAIDTALNYILQSMDANSPDIDSTILIANSEQWSTFVEANYYSNHALINSIQLFSYITKAQHKKANTPKTLNQHYQLAQIAMQINERIRNNLTGEKDKLRILNRNTTLIEHGIESALLLEKEVYLEEAFNFAERNKSILLADAIKGDRARVLGDLPDALILQEVNLKNKISKLNQKSLKRRTEEEKRLQNQALSDLQSKLEAFVASIKDKYPKYHALKYENITAEASHIQALLEDHTALIEYFLTDSICYLFWLSKTEIKVYPIAIPLDKLKGRIELFQHTLSSYNTAIKNEERAYQNYIKIAHWFYKNLIEVALVEKDIEHLIIIADGELGHLPFETFLRKDVANEAPLAYKDLPFLLKDYTISYNYSATLWKENLTMKEPVNNGKMLACAAHYSPVDSSLAEMRLPYFYDIRSLLQTLPAAQQEVKALSNEFEGTFLWQDSTNERFFKQNAAEYAVIHLAMHGILEPNRPMLSSLVFTEDKDSLEDNFLQAYEISRLKLNANLVVLSACETGYGKFEQGEGVVSLARSFMYAGVPSLVVSLWQVNDVSTALIMKQFYKNLAEGMNKALALKKAKLSYLENTTGAMAHPAFWSPFIQLGDTKPIYLKAKGAWNYWALGSILVALVLGLFLWRRFRPA